MTSELGNFFSAIVDIENMSILITSDMKKIVLCKIHMPKFSRFLKTKNAFLDDVLHRTGVTNSKAVLCEGDIFDLHEGVKIALERSILKIVRRVRVRGQLDKICVNEHALRGAAYSYLHSVFFSKKIFSAIDKQRKEWNKWNRAKS